MSQNSQFIKTTSIVLALLAMMVSGAIVLKHEQQLKNSHPIYMKLKPVDPRSIMQGDYMRLRYQLNLVDNIAVVGTEDEREFQMKQRDDILKVNNELIENKHKLHAFVHLDEQKIVSSVNLTEKDTTHQQPLVIKNPENSVSDLYVASKSFMFAEGLAGCYDDAEYAKIMVDDDGNAILDSLVGDKLQNLNCENNHS